MGHERRALRRRCQRLIDELAIPQPITMMRLVTAVAERQGKSIELSAVAAPETSFFGMLVRTPAADFILYDEDATPLHQFHIVAHEIGHLLLRHRSPQRADPAQIRDIAPDLSRRLVENVLESAIPTDQQEKEAEAFALRIITRATAAQIRGSASADRLASTFDLTRLCRLDPATLAGSHRVASVQHTTAGDGNRTGHVP
jgi:hypothetical protein